LANDFELSTTQQIALLVRIMKITRNIPRGDNTEVHLQRDDGSKVRVLIPAWDAKTPENEQITNDQLKSDQNKNDDPVYGLNFVFSGHYN